MNNVELAKLLSILAKCRIENNSYISREEKEVYNVIDERKTLTQMSNELYNLLGDNAKLKGRFTPHVTIGKHKSAEVINQIFEASQSSLQSSYRSTISTIYCKRLIQNSNGNIKLEDEIEYKLP